MEMQKSVKCSRLDMLVSVSNFRNLPSAMPAHSELLITSIANTILPFGCSVVANLSQAPAKRTEVSFLITAEPPPEPHNTFHRITLTLFCKLSIC